MSPPVNIHRRLGCYTFDLALPVGQGVHALKVSLAYDELTGELRELAFVSRGKSGTGLDHLLTELGIRLSRAIQQRDPETGSPLG